MSCNTARVFTFSISLRQLAGYLGMEESECNSVDTYALSGSPLPGKLTCETDNAGLACTV